jgi:hypothetical protein
MFTQKINEVMNENNILKQKVAYLEGKISDLIKQRIQEKKDSISN